MKVGDEEFFEMLVRYYDWRIKDHTDYKAIALAKQKEIKERAEELHRRASGEKDGK